MRPIHAAHLDKTQPVLILTREIVRPHLNRVTVASITSIIRGLSTEVPVGTANGLDHDSVISCGNIVTMPVATATSSRSSSATGPSRWTASRLPSGPAGMFSQPTRPAPAEPLSQALILSLQEAARADTAAMTAGQPTVTLWRPTGPKELALVEASGWRAWPPRLPGQPIFYPVLNRDYAVRIASDWNVKHSGAGYVTEFRVRKDFLDRYPVQQAGGRTILEYWIPAEDLEEFNGNIIGLIEVVDEFHA